MSSTYDKPTVADYIPFDSQVPGCSKPYLGTPLMGANNRRNIYAAPVKLPDQRQVILVAEPGIYHGPKLATLEGLQVAAEMLAQSASETQSPAQAEKIRKDLFALAKQVAKDRHYIIAPRFSGCVMTFVLAPTAPLQRISIAYAIRAAHYGFYRKHSPITDKPVPASAAVTELSYDEQLVFRESRAGRKLQLFRSNSSLPNIAAGRVLTIAKRSDQQLFALKKNASLLPIQCVPILSTPTEVHCFGRPCPRDLVLHKLDPKRFAVHVAAIRHSGLYILAPVDSRGRAVLDPGDDPTDLRIYVIQKLVPPLASLPSVRASHSASPVASCAFTSMLRIAASNQECKALRSMIANRPCLAVGLAELFEVAMAVGMPKLSAKDLFDANIVRTCDVAENAIVARQLEAEHMSGGTSYAVIPVMDNDPTVGQ